MKALTSAALMLVSTFNFSQSITGKWKTIDDETGKAVSVVEIYERARKIYGKVHDIIDPRDRNKLCSNCTGDDKDKPLIGLIVIKGLVKEGSEYNSGKILDPKHGKIYKCSIILESKDKLKVRGYIGISLFGRTQYWHRIKG